MFFKNTKRKIIELAHNAVMVAETELATESGINKKKMAINYILKNLPMSEFCKGIIGICLSGFIDDAVEYSVKYLKSLQKTQED